MTGEALIGACEDEFYRVRDSLSERIQFWVCVVVIKQD